MKSGTGNEPRQTLGDGHWGFTLLEVILVIVVMTLAMALTYPALMRSRTAFHLRAVGRDVINAIRIARETAVTEQKTMMMTIDNEGRKMVVSDDVGGDERVYNPPADVAVIALTPGGAEGLQQPLTVRFLSNGSSESAQILVKAETGAWLRIELDPVTGSGRMILNQGDKKP